MINRKITMYFVFCNEDGIQLDYAKNTLFGFNKNPIAIIENEKDFYKTMLDHFFFKHKEHYELWCEAHNKDATSMDSLFEYYNLAQEQNEYPIYECIKIKYKKSNLINLLNLMATRLKEIKK